MDYSGEVVVRGRIIGKLVKDGKDITLHYRGLEELRYFINVDGNPSASVNGSDTRLRDLVKEINVYRLERRK